MRDPSRNDGQDNSLKASEWKRRLGQRSSTHITGPVLQRRRQHFQGFWRRFLRPEVGNRSRFWRCGGARSSAQYPRDIWTCTSFITGRSLPRTRSGPPSSRVIPRYGACTEAAFETVVYGRIGRCPLLNRWRTWEEDGVEDFLLVGGGYRDG